MDFTEVVRSRRMVRNFQATPILEEILLRILDLARRGPSAGFTQGQDFIKIVKRFAGYQCCSRITGITNEYVS